MFELKTIKCCDQIGAHFNVTFDLPTEYVDKSRCLVASSALTYMYICHITTCDWLRQIAKQI